LNYLYHLRTTWLHVFERLKRYMNLGLWYIGTFIHV